MALRSRIIFITGTDTGVGKTTLTALLLAHLRANGVEALAVKPFCSGDRADAELLSSLQDNELTLEQVNPYFFPEPVAPLAARQRRSVPLSHVMYYLHDVAGTCECLLVEGIGGVLVPLGRDYTVLDLTQRLRCEVLVVARNQLGSLNHTLLTMCALRSPVFHASRTRRAEAAGEGGSRSPLHAPRSAVVLMQPRVADASSASNPRILSELLKPVPVLSLPYLGSGCNRLKQIVACALKHKARLEQILG